MARVNVEESAMAAARQIAGVTGMPYYSVLGRLVSLWHGSQALEKTVATRKQLVVWLGMEGDTWTDGEIDSFIAEMCDCEILKEVPAVSAWQIVGNEKHIDRLREFKVKASNGGKASAEKRKRAKRTLQAHASTVRSNQPASSQFNSIQFNSVQDNSKKKEDMATPAKAGLPAVAPKESLPGQAFVRAYVKAYQRRYGEKTRPSIDGQVQGRIKTLLASTPLERAINMIEVYLQMDDAWFKTKAHDFETFMQNLTKVGLALDTGSQTRINWDDIEKASNA